MDPVTLIGILGSLVSIGDVVGRCIKKLTGLRSSYRNAPMVTTMLIGQLYIIQSALDQLLSVWSSKTFKQHPRYQQLALQMTTALESFGPLMLAVDTRLNDMTAGQGIMTRKNKLSFLWNEREMDSFFTLVDRQVNALNLLLQTIQCNTWTEQQRIINDDESQDILRLARDCSSSILGICDQESILTETSNGISVDFAFDHLLLNCKPYLSAHRSHLRQAIHSTRLRTNINHVQLAEVESLLSNDAEDVPAGGFENLSARSASPVTVSGMSVEDAEPPSHFEDKVLSTQSRLNVVEQFLETLDEISRSSALHLAEEVCTVKILLLGTSESGKSTLSKGFQLLFDEGYIEKAREDFKGIILGRTVESFKVILEAMVALGIPLQDRRTENHARTIFNEPMYVEYEYLPAEVTAAIKSLWIDVGFQEAYERRREYQLDTNLEHYVKSIERLERLDYLPTTTDVLQIGVKSAGIAGKSFLYNNVDLHIFDVGGSRIERKKWIHCYEDAHVVLFTVDAFAYDKVLVEDESVSRMQEQLVLFESIINSSWFPQTRFVLVFTKVDLVEQNLSRSHPARFLPDFKHRVVKGVTATFDDYMKYLEGRFLSLVPAWHQKTIRIVNANLVDVDTYTVCRYMT